MTEYVTYAAWAGLVLACGVFDARAISSSGGVSHAGPKLVEDSEPPIARIRALATPAGGPVMARDTVPNAILSGVPGNIIVLAGEASPSGTGARDDRGNIQWLLETLKSWGAEQQDQHERVEAMSRGGESSRLSMPLLSSSARQSVAAGTRSFYLAWVGGVPPFSVALTGPAGTERSAWQQVGVRAVAARIRLEEGFYEARVTDASGRSVLGSFEATSEFPALDQRQIDGLPPDIRNAVLAARLAGLDDGVWRLEAYERLASEPNDWASRVTAGRLMQGQSLSDLRKLMPPGH